MWLCNALTRQICFMGWVRDLWKRITEKWKILFWEVKKPLKLTSIWIPNKCPQFPCPEQTGTLFNMWQQSFWVYLLNIKYYFFSTEKAMAPHSSTPAWKIPWMEEPGRLQSMGSLRVGHDWATSLSLFPFMHWRRKWQPTPVFLPGESQGRGSLVAAIYGVAQSQTRLKWLSIA